MNHTLSISTHITSLGVALLCTALQVDSFAQTRVSYNRDIRPLLATKCFTCHGPDAAQRKGDLRLDQPAGLTNGSIIVPGKPQQSKLIARIRSSAPETRMPPPDQKEQLNESEKRQLEEWIRNGGRHEGHWAFIAPLKGTPPQTTAWDRNVIDSYVRVEMSRRGLSPQKEAEKHELLRRVSFDLTGLPPTTTELKEFLRDDAENAYEQVVDRLLESPRFGERMAAWWLDGARYGDSHGYDNDLENSQWPWRNWVIGAFNRNMPFDQFTVEQIAGDRLPNARPDQILATAFNRNHRIQTEDGAIDEEWRSEYVIDRVETIGAVWLGLTLGCARCHDHKYDPLTQKDFYQLYAMFNNLDEKGFINNLRGSAEPRIRYRPDEYQRQVDAFKKTLQGKAQKKAIAALDGRFPYVMIMQDMTKARPTHILIRGHYDKKGDLVQPGLPSALANGRTQADRLEFARWIVSGQHPLTGRVFVNRIWEQLFGIGIVESSENLGVQADWPSHPELLDWLAVDFAQDWNIKRTIRQIVISSTYRQSNKLDQERLELDPKNRLLSRGPRVRLSAEMVRDQALMVGGLMEHEMGGPSVRPYQPAGFWKDVEKRGTFQQSKGKSLYRRSLYTAIRRTVAAPDMVLFDLPSREICTIRRSRSNTPLQSLSLMNNVTYVEAARHLAARMLRNGATATERITWGFVSVLQRHPTSLELQILTSGLSRRLKEFQQNPKQAEELIQFGDSRTPGAPVELSAMTTVANILLNLDESLHK